MVLFHTPDIGQHRNVKLKNANRVYTAMNAIVTHKVRLNQVVFLPSRSRKIAIDTFSSAKPMIAAIMDWT